MVEIKTQRPHQIILRTSEVCRMAQIIAPNGEMQVNGLGINVKRRIFRPPDIVIRSEGKIIFEKSKRTNWEVHMIGEAYNLEERLREIFHPQGW